MNELITRANAITSQYLERFGRVRIGIYHIFISQHEPFSNFLNSLLVTLRRKDLMPYYAWFSTVVPETRYLILWCNGYFKTDLSDITPIIDHLGALHYLPSINETSFIDGDVLAVDRITSLLDSLISRNYAITDRDNRSFGTSVLLG